MARMPVHVAQPMKPDPREERLPAWAAATIRQLRRRVTDAEDSAREARLSNGPADTDTFLDPYDETPIRLQKGARIRFDVGDPGDWRNFNREYVDVSVRRDFTGGPAYVELHGGGFLAIQPRSSNVARVALIND